MGTRSHFYKNLQPVCPDTCAYFLSAKRTAWLFSDDSCFPRKRHHFMLSPTLVIFLLSSLLYGPIMRFDSFSGILRHLTLFCLAMQMCCKELFTTEQFYVSIFLPFVLDHITNVRLVIMRTGRDRRKPITGMTCMPVRWHFHSWDNSINFSLIWNVELNWKVFVKFNCGANCSTESLFAFLVFRNYANASFRISFDRFILLTLWYTGL
jgi:hypothetical protein